MVTVVLVGPTVGTAIAEGDNVETGCVTWGSPNVPSTSAGRSAEPPQEPSTIAAIARRDWTRTATHAMLPSIIALARNSRKGRMAEARISRAKDVQIVPSPSGALRSVVGGLAAGTLLGTDDGSMKWNLP